MKKERFHAHKIRLRPGGPEIDSEVHIITEDGISNPILEITSTAPGGHVHVHRMQVGSQSHPVSESHDVVQLEHDLAAARTFSALMADSCRRSHGLLGALAEKLVKNDASV